MLVRTGVAALWGLVVSGLLPAQAAEPGSRLVVEGGRTLERYLDGAETAALRFDAACAQARSTAARIEGERTIRLRAGGDSPAISGTGLSDPAIGTLAGSASDLLKAVSALTGTASASTYLIRMAPGRIFIGIDGRGGRQFDDVCAGLGYLLTLIAADMGANPEALAQAATPDAVFKALTARQGPQRDPIAVLQQGATASLRLEGWTGEAHSFSGPPGVHLYGQHRDDTGALVMTAHVSGQAPAGAHWLTAYAPGSRLRAVKRWPLTIVTGNASAPPPFAVPVEMTAGEQRAGQLTGQGTATYRIAVDRPGTLVVASQGLTDTAARLTGPKGTLLGTDDDGGAGWNFRLETPVEPGVYTLDVDHCCGGAGDFSLTSAID